MKIHVLALLASAIFSASAVAQAYKCKTPSGSYEFSDQPCRAGATAKVVGRENISESQYRSSTDWIRRESARLDRKERIEEAQRVESQQRQAAAEAAAHQEMLRQQDANDRYQLMRKLDQTAAAAERAESAARKAQEDSAAAAAAASKKHGPANCYQKMNGRIICD